MIVRAVFRAASAPLVRRALPVAAGLGVVAAVFFGPMGVTASDVVWIADREPLGRAALWLIWLLPTAPAAFVALDPPGTMWLRTQPVARWRLAVAAALLLGLVELTLGLFVLRGGGPERAALWFGVAFALHAQGFAGVRRVVDALGLVLGVALAFAPYAFWPASLVLAAWCLVRAFHVAPERGASSGRARVGGPPVVALARAHLIGVIRTEGAALGRGALVVVIAGAACGLVGRNNQVAAWSSLALAFAGPALALALSGPVTAVLRHETMATPILDAAGTSAGTRVTAGGLAAAALGLVGGALFAAGLAVPAGLVALPAGMTVAVGLAGTHRHALADAAKATYRLTISVILAGVAFATAAALVGTGALAIWGLGAAAAIWASAPLAAKQHDPEDAWGVEGR